jgi:hypothetical protein
MAGNRIIKTSELYCFYAFYVVTYRRSPTYEILSYVTSKNAIFRK